MRYKSLPARRQPVNGAGEKGTTKKQQARPSWTSLLRYERGRGFTLGGRQFGRATPALAAFFPYATVKLWPLLPLVGFSTLLADLRVKRRAMFLLDGLAALLTDTRVELRPILLAHRLASVPGLLRPRRWAALCPSHCLRLS